MNGHVLLDDCLAIISMLVTANYLISSVQIKGVFFEDIGV